MTPAGWLRYPSLPALLGALLLALWALGPVATSHAQAQDEETISPADSDPASDRQIRERIEGIFAEIEGLRQVSVAVRSGVVSLGGTTVEAADVERAAALAGRVDGVVAVESDIRRDASLERQLSPVVQEARSLLDSLLRFAPLTLLAIAVFVVLFWIGGRLARWTWLWDRLAPNGFIAELLQTSVRIGFVGLALIAALSLLDATAFLSAFLGAAGVIGLAVGFAVRDTIENYVCSIMLSIRQPFRPNDHVVVDGCEGRVVRLTSRATVLLTMDGNHLRIPNAAVFKAVILNYSRNHLRRFEFELGVDADDDPLAAIETAVATMKGLDFLEAEPEPFGIVKEVGDSNIVLSLYGWIDQQNASFHKARSIAVSAVKSALEEAGFALPEPIYRLRFDQGAPIALNRPSEAAAPAQPSPARPAPARPLSAAGPARHEDVRPERDLERQVDAERQHTAERDLLDERAPVE